MVLLNFEISEDIKRNFKIKCAEDDIKMSYAMRMLVIKYNRGEVDIFDDRLD